MKSRTGQKSVRKGKAGEREFIRTIAELTDDQVQLNRHLDQSRDGGDDTGTGCFSIEIKRHKTASQSQLREWWQQCQRNAARQNKVPVLAFRADQQSWQVLMHPNYGFSEDDVRGCLRMDAALFCRYLMDPREFAHASAQRCH